MNKAIAGEKPTNWRRILVRLCEAAIRPSSLYGQFAATSMLEEKRRQARWFVSQQKSPKATAESESLRDCGQHSDSQHRCCVR
jgi:hypothetical protein